MTEILFIDIALIIFAVFLFVGLSLHKVFKDISDNAFGENVSFQRFLIRPREDEESDESYHQRINLARERHKRGETWLW